MMAAVLVSVVNCAVCGKFAEGGNIFFCNECWDKWTYPGLLYHLIIDYSWLVLCAGLLLLLLSVFTGSILLIVLSAFTLLFGSIMHR